MAKFKAKTIVSRDTEWLKMLAEECDNYTGREYKLDVAKGVLVIYTKTQKPRKTKKDRDEERKPRRGRDED